LCARYFSPSYVVFVKSATVSVRNRTKVGNPKIDTTVHESGAVTIIGTRRNPPTTGSARPFSNGFFPGQGTTHTHTHVTVTAANRPNNTRPVHRVGHGIKTVRLLFATFAAERDNGAKFRVWSAVYTFVRRELNRERNLSVIATGGGEGDRAVRADGTNVLKSERTDGTR